MPSLCCSISSCTGELSSGKVLFGEDPGMDLGAKIALCAREEQAEIGMNATV